MNEHILIIDDELAIREMVRMALENEDFVVSDASNAHSAKKLIEENTPSLILLDWMMPGVSGIDFATRLRKDNTYQEMGIIMLTARDDEQDRIRGLDVGADDYVSKPFSTRELISRIRAVLRRIKKPIDTDRLIEIGRIKINTDMYQVTIDGKHVELSPTEFRLLHFMMAHSKRTFSRDQLLDNVWGEHIYVDERTVDVHIRRLRKVLEDYDCSHYIKTIRGVGYCFVAED